MSRSKGLSEAEVMRKVRFEVGQHPERAVLWRNNVGTAMHFDKRTGTIHPVEYGLAPGSSDLVGLTCEGQFVALELKRERGGRVEPEQEMYLELVRKLGGIAGVARSAAEAKRVLGWR